MNDLIRLRKGLPNPWMITFKVLGNKVDPHISHYSFFPHPVLKLVYLTNLTCKCISWLDEMLFRCELILLSEVFGHSATNAAGLTLCTFRLHFSFIWEEKKLHTTQLLYKVVDYKLAFVFFGNMNAYLPCHQPGLKDWIIETANCWAARVQITTVHPLMD